jgi:hypothetical protein
MFNTAKLCTETQEFMTWLGLGERPRSLLATLAIAKALADMATLPSGPVESPEQFYATTSLHPNQLNLNLLNELVVVDIDAIMEYIERFYKTRYNILFPSERIFCSRPETALQDFMGISTALDQNAVDAITSNSLDATRLYNGIRIFFKEATKGMSNDPQ